MSTRVAVQKALSKCSASNTDLKGIIAQKIPKHAALIKQFRKDKGKSKIMDVELGQMYNGMRGIRSMVYETSLLDPNEGIRFRGLTIPDCQKRLPKAPGGKEPLPEGIFWLMLTGDVPTQEQVNWLSKEWAKRAKLPSHVVKSMDTMSKTVHPMAQLSAAVTILSAESKFQKAYASGVKKTVYWEYVYEDCMDLLAKLPVIAAKIYNHSFRSEDCGCVEIDPSKDWSYNLMTMMGYSDPQFAELMRLYLTIHCDHEGGNASAHTIHLVGSTLSDPFISFAAGMNALAGPLHGLANQEVLVWINRLREKLGDDPDEKRLKDFVWKTLKSGQVVPGYGHAVLRITDPRYTCQREFAEKHLPDDPVFKLVSAIYKVVPPILKELGKVANPWPNVDAHSGVLLQYYGLTQMSYYTVLFGVSRAMGTLAQLVWSRGIGFPIERPKSLTTEALMKQLGGKKKKC
ncbi:unnamed protein product [Psylliodes chrysocephalus]|uniref:Citrate synthase n=1 Tax=Psylliodes chrysocephalus TaxID=3402493 RepID=A0A9P0GIQ3_9CUCU|nr:unnamed protein product [Psylliodes chrysocephala]